MRFKGVQKKPRPERSVLREEEPFDKGQRQVVRVLEAEELKLAHEQPAAGHLLTTYGARFYRTHCSMGRLERRVLGMVATCPAQSNVGSRGTDL